MADVWQAHANGLARCHVLSNDGVSLCDSWCPRQCPQTSTSRRSRPRVLSFRTFWTCGRQSSNIFWIHELIRKTLNYKSNVEVWNGQRKIHVQVFWKGCTEELSFGYHATFQHLVQTIACHKENITRQLQALKKSSRNIISLNKWIILATNNM